MNTDGLLLHQAIVQTSDPATGLCTVRIPALMGGQVVTVNHDGLVLNNGTWNVPNVGTTVSVSSTTDMRMFSWVISPPQSVVANIPTDPGDPGQPDPDPFPQYAMDTDLTALLNSIQNKLVPAGTVVATIRSTPDTGYLFINGQTVVNAQTLYPSLWAAVPALWKTGANLVFPDWRSRTLVMDDAGTTFVLGSTAGAMSKTISTLNLPNHSHDISHDHGSTLSFPASTSHTHTYSGTTATENAAHYHTFTGGDAGWVMGSTVPSTFALGNGGTTVLYATLSAATATESAAHAHTFSGTTSTDGGSHQHSFSVPVYSGLSGNGAFSNQPLDVTPAAGIVNFQIKAH